MKKKSEFHQIITVSRKKEEIKNPLTEEEQRLEEIREINRKLFAELEDEDYLFHINRGLLTRHSLEYGG